MPDDQQISQSVDNLISQTSDDHVVSAGEPTAPSFSLGSNPSAGQAADSNSFAAAAPADDSTALPPPAGPSDDEDGVLNVSSSHDDSNAANTNDDLGQIKQQALSQLTPIISELDQPPEEKYRTLMMLIQASDDRTLIKSAFEAANSIEDKKVKAEALLNIVNEINYFSTGQQPGSQSKDQL